MRRKYLCLLAIIGLLTGCAVGDTVVMKPMEGRPASYQVIEIPNFEGGSNVPEWVKQEIPAKVIERLTLDKAFPKVVQASAATTEPDRPALLMEGRVLQFNPGSRFKRYIAGGLGGAGRGKVIVNAKFIDKKSGTLLTESNFEGEIAAGIFGGGIKETQGVIIDEIVKFIETNFGSVAVK